MAEKKPFFKPMKAKRLSERVAQEVKDLIWEGRLRPGDLLPPEREMAQQMGVSRTAVREALKMLEATGFVEIRQGGGAKVKEVLEEELLTPFQQVIRDDPQRMMELMEVRSLLEEWAARQAARTRSKENLRRLEKYVIEMEEALQEGRLDYEKDFLFHSEIGLATQNRVYYHIIRTIYHLFYFPIRFAIEDVLKTQEVKEEIVRDHREIFEGIKTRRPEEAAEAMSRHLERVKGEFERFLSAKEVKEGML